jgi:glucose/arabinose dehydrogenase
MMQRYRRFVSWAVVACVALMLVLLGLNEYGAAPVVQAQGQNYCAAGQQPQFLFGFAFLKSQLGATMGEPTECEHPDEQGNSVQTTTTGRALYVTRINTPTFIRGSTHWAWTSRGLVTWTGDAIEPPVNAQPAQPSPAGPPASPTPGTTLSNPAVSLQLVAEGLTAPVALTYAPDGSGRLFIADQAGTVRVIGADGRLLPEPFLDVRNKMVRLNGDYDERGLLGLAFHPNYRANGRFFVYYSAPLRVGAPGNWDHTSHVSEFRVSGVDANRADPNSERVLMQVDQPQSNHNAGTLAFGPEGFLYISLGDGGAADDVGVGHVPDWYTRNGGGNGQDTTQNLLGSILRIDVDGGNPYGIPRDNPFVGQNAGLDEIFAYGFRNPYRFSFDMGGKRQMFVGDAGQALYEEVSIVERGGNYGWNVKEGTHCFSTEDPTAPPATCPNRDAEGDPLIDPIIEYSHAQGGLVVVGGYVYRGEAIPALRGVYLFGDWSSNFAQPRGSLYAAAPRPTGGLWQWQRVRLTNQPNGNLGRFVLALGQDASGEVYLLTSDATGPSESTGKVFRLAPP